MSEEGEDAEEEKKTHNEDKRKIGYNNRVSLFFYVFLVLEECFCFLFTL